LVVCKGIQSRWSTCLLPCTCAYASQPCTLCERVQLRGSHLTVLRAQQQLTASD
jgi:hypothetical protein